jgi:prophage antirepressor-like protein
MINKVGVIEFDDAVIDVYDSLDKPLFKLIDIADAINIPEEKFWDVVSLCESDEIIMFPAIPEDDGISRIYITESGLYNVLSQSRDLIARKWRRVIIKELIELRKTREMDICDQFEEWDRMLDDIYFDEDTGTLMVSVLTQGGDVTQVPYDADVNGDI